jgi:hypothetical protein
MKKQGCGSGSGSRCKNAIYFLKKFNLTLLKKCFLMKTKISLEHYYPKKVLKITPTADKKNYLHNYHKKVYVKFTVEIQILGSPIKSMRIRNPPFLILKT